MGLVKVIYVDGQTVISAKNLNDIQDAIIALQEEGIDGLTPFIGDNGNWWIGETDTGIKAQGADGNDYVLTEDDKSEIAKMAVGNVRTELSSVLLPEVTAENNGAFLRVADGAWAAVMLTDASKEGA